MNYIKTNKELLFKYLIIIISNILVVIFSNFYFKTSEYKELIMLFITIIIDMLIYYYRGKKTFKIYLDSITNFIIGLILMFFIKDSITYGMILFSLFLSNNIVFIRSRLSDKFLIKNLQYISILLLTILCMLINLLIYNIIF